MARYTSTKIGRMFGVEPITNSNGEPTGRFRQFRKVPMDPARARFLVSIPYKNNVFKVLVSEGQTINPRKEYVRAMRREGYTWY